MIKLLSPSLSPLVLRPSGGVGGKHSAPFFPEALALVQRGADMSDDERQDQ